MSYVARQLSQLDAARAFTASVDQQAWYSTVLQTARKIAPDKFASNVQKATRSMIDKTLNVAGLVSQIGLPYTAVGATARTIVQKLNLQPDRDVFSRLATSVSTLTNSVKSLLHK